MRMKSKIAGAAVAAFLLTYAAVSNATDVSRRPVAGTALIFPNLIFGLDDSGSMDYEVLFTTNNGLFWWNMNTGTGWNTDGTALTPPLPSDGSSLFPSEDYRSYAYLFPLGRHEFGVFDGKLLYLQDGLGPGFANYQWGNVAPPTAQFAPLRSSAYNTIYYDPTRTYVPWKDRYDASSTADPKAKSYGQATSTNALSHPEQSSSAGAKLTLSTATTVSGVSAPADGTYFVMYSGTKVPAGARYRLAGFSGDNPGAWSGVLGAELTLPEVSGDPATYHVAMPYYPATYWVKETCTVPSPLPAITDCAPGPDGATLKRYEIRVGTAAEQATIHPSGRNAVDEMANFANWFTYYRKRQNMMAAALGELIDGLNGIRIGWIKMNSVIDSSGNYANPANITMYDANSPDYALNGRRLLESVYLQQLEARGTPTRQMLKFIGQQHLNNTSIIQYSCQRNNALVVTDGFASPDTSSLSTAPTYSTSTYFPSSPYTTIHKPSLADLASAYYAIDLRGSRTDLASGKVTPESPTTTNADLNKNLHMNTYGLTLGSQGTLWKKDSAGKFPGQFPSSGISWPAPTQQSPTAVDDLWHATVNGRGQMYTSVDAVDTAEALEEALADILNKGGTQTGVGVLSVNLREGAKAFVAGFNANGWSGDFESFAVDPATGVVRTSALPEWKAGKLLDDMTYTDRVLVTSKNGIGVEFNSSNIGATQLTTSPTITGASPADVVNYFRGDRSKEAAPAVLRRRTSLFGAIVNAQPAIDANVDAGDNFNVGYVPASDGFVHAIDLNNGKELWAYMPSFVHPRLRTMAKKTWAFTTVVDGSPTIGKVGSTKYLVGGLGTGGTGYYGLDITSPRQPDVSDAIARVKWEFPSASTSTAIKNNMGLSMGKPLFVRIKNTNTTAVLVTSGYNTPAAGDGRGRVYVLNPATGNFLAGFSEDTFKTGAGVPSFGNADGEAGLTHLTPFVEPDGTVQYVYGGDLLGNVWRFDLVNSGSRVLKITTLKDKLGNPQPIAAPVGTANFRGVRALIVGTGRILGASDYVSQSSIDAGTAKTQSVYVFTEPDGDSVLANPRDTTKMVEQVLSLSGTNRRIAAPAGVDWGTKRGWFIDLLKGERANTRPFLLDGVVVFVTNTPNLDACSADAFLYRVGFLSGDEVFDNLAGVRISYTFSASGLGVRTTAEGSKVIIHRNEERCTTAGCGEQIQTCKTDGNDTQTCGVVGGKSMPPQKNSWRQVLRED